jgi:hypothetical protein
MSETCEKCMYHSEADGSLGFCHLDSERVCCCPSQKEMEQVGCDFFEEKKNEN